MSKHSEFREKIVNEFLSVLNEDELPWEKGWISMAAFNPATGTVYKGLNSIWLHMISQKNKWTDPRFCTFNQAKSNGWKILAGSKGTQVEFFSPYDIEEKKKLSYRDIEKLKSILTPEELSNRIKYIAQIYTVFNAEQIEGIPELKLQPKSWSSDDVVEKRDTLFKNMELSFKEVGDRAYYAPAMDTIVLPPIEMFKDEYSYLSTMLHEAGHATGSPKRLDRNLQGLFGSEDYAREELRAEIASTFVSQEIGLPPNHSGEFMDNHKAYIQSWISVLKNDPKELFRACKDAEKISDYLIEKGEFDRTVSQIKDVKKLEDRKDSDLTKLAADLNKKALSKAR